MREIRLSGYLPPFEREYSEFRAVFAAEEPELLLAWEKAGGLRDDMFLQTAGMEALRRYEGICGMTPLLSDDAESLRMRLLSRWMEDIPYTERSLRAYLTALYGAENYALLVDHGGYDVMLRLLHRAGMDYGGLYRLLRDMLPANLELGLAAVLRGRILVRDILRYAGFVYNYVLDGRWVLGEGLPFVSNANWREEAGHLVLTEALKGELAAYIAPRIDKALLNGSYAVEEFKVKEAASGGVVLEYEVTDSAAPAVIESIALLSGGVTWMEERTEIHRAGNLSLRHEISIEAGGN